MNVALREVDIQQKRALAGLFQSKAFDLLLSCIEAEYHYEAHTMKLGVVDLAFEPEAKLDREMLVKAARLKVAMDVLQEFAASEKTHYELLLES